MSALVTSEIFRLFVNTLTPDDKYSRRNIQVFWQQFQTPLSQQGKPFCEFCIAFLKCTWNLEHSEKKEDYPIPITTEIIIRKRCLLKRLKGCASPYHSIINVLTGSKHCWSQNGTTIFLFFREFEINWVGKSLPYSNLNSCYCLLTRWLPMTSIPVEICRYCSNNFKRFYLNKETHFIEFCLYYWNVHQIWNILKKKNNILA